MTVKLVYLPKYKKALKYEKGINMLDDCQYNVVKTLHELSSLCWFLEKHAITDSQKSYDTQCANILETIKGDLEKHIQTLNQMIKK